MACQTCLFFFFTNSFFFWCRFYSRHCALGSRMTEVKDPQGSLSVAAEWTVSRGTVSSKPEARTQAREGLDSCFLVSSARFLSVLWSPALSPFTPLLHNIPHLVVQQHPPSWLLLDTRATCESGPGLHLSVHPICEYISMCLEPCWPLIPAMIPPALAFIPGHSVHYHLLVAFPASFGRTGMPSHHTWLLPPVSNTHLAWLCVLQQSDTDCICMQLLCQHMNNAWVLSSGAHGSAWESGVCALRSGCTLCVVLAPCD